jgi:N-methylhydantoinase B
MVTVVPHKGADTIWKSTNTAGSDQSNAQGIHGGYPGAGSQCSVVRDSKVWKQYAAGAVALDLPGLDGEVHHLPSKSEGSLGPNDVFAFYPPGGGGYGDPLDREPERVLGDVAAGAVTAEGARRHYGVVLADQDVDIPATQTLRDQLRRQRLDGGPETVEPGAGINLVAEHVIGEYLEVAAGFETGTAVIRCRRCGTVLAEEGEDPRGGAIRRQEPLAAAGPWLAERFGGNSPNFVLHEAICPGCGTLFDIEERLRSDLGPATPRLARPTSSGPGLSS